MDNVGATFLASPWAGVAAAASFLIGFFCIVLGYTLGMREWGFNVSWRLRGPFAGLGVLYIWRGWAILQAHVITIAALVVLLATALVAFIALIEMVVNAWTRWQAAKADKAVLDAVSPMPAHTFDPFKSFRAADDHSTAEPSKK